MAHGFVKRQFIHRSCKEHLSKAKYFERCPHVSMGIYFRREKAGMAGNVRAWRIADNGIRLQGTVVDFYLKFKIKIF